MPVTAHDQRERPAPARALVGLLVPTALALTSAVLAWACAAPISAVRAPGPAPVDALLALGAALACAGLLALATLGATLWLATLVTGQAAGRIDRLAHLLTPRLLRATVGLAVGVTVVVGPAGGLALGLEDIPVTPHAGGSSGAPALPPGWNPDRPAAISAATPPAPSEHPATSERGGNPIAGRPGTRAEVGAVVVHRGDTLWAIAARHLGHGATDAQVATEWPRWQATNRATIGPDPDLILPGQRLRPPRAPAPPDQAPAAREESP